LESNDYKRLPGGIFNRSFVKAYARCVGFDEKLALEGYASFMRARASQSMNVDLTPHHSKVYTEAPATRSPLLTVSGDRDSGDSYAWRAGRGSLVIKGACHPLMKSNATSSIYQPKRGL